MKYVAGLAVLGVMCTSAPAFAQVDPVIRVDASLSTSTVSDGLPDWRESLIALSRQFGDGWAGAVKVESQSRFDKHDTYVELRFDRTFSNGAFYLATGGAADAEFRPEVAIKAGGSLDLGRARGATLLIIDADVSHFANSDVYAFRVGIDQLLTTNGWRASLQAVSVAERDGRALLGFVARSEFPIGPRLSGRIGYADAPETSEGVVVRVKGWNGGLRFDVNDSWLIRMDLTHEDRGFYTRDEVSAGVAYRF